MTEKDFRIALNLIPGLGKTLFFRLARFFGSAENVFKAKEPELRQVEGIGLKLASEILRFDVTQKLEKEKTLAKNNGARILITSDSEYPESLKNLYDPPPVLYTQGEMQDLGLVSIAIVGTRAPTNYGKLVAEKLSKGLAAMGIAVVSGMARGVDSIAHKGAIDAGGKTVAVFGCGLNVIYPPENIRLRNIIIKHGAIVSEFPMSRKPDKGNFPARNRIISGLSLGTVVVEAEEKSGALITTQFALDQGKDVFAVPGNINSPKSKGTNLLIKNGAKLVESAEDIIDEIPNYIKKGFSKERERNTIASVKIKLSEEEDRLISAIDPATSHIDSIIEKSGLPPNKVSALLLTLELNGVVKQLPGKIFAIS